MSLLSRRMVLSTVVGAGVLSAALPSLPAVAATPDIDLTAGFTAADRPAIFYSPHADDETISMGIDIANHLSAGRNVLVVLMTNGGSQWIIDALNGVSRDNLYGVYHNPVREKYHTGPLTLEEVKNLRLREFQGATSSLNLISGRLRNVNVGLPEGINLAQARAVIEQLHSLFPGASHKTMSYTDTATDHNVCGIALRQMRDEKKINDVRWYVAQSRLSAAQNSGVSVLRIPARDETVSNALKLALLSYKTWSPALGAYAWGAHSVGAQINNAEATLYDYYHN